MWSCRGYMAVRNPKQSRWDSFSDDELEAIRESFQDAEDEGNIGSVGAALLNEIQNEMDLR
jgi:hypothetical protein